MPEAEIFRRDKSPKVGSSRDHGGYLAGAEPYELTSKGLDPLDQDSGKTEWTRTYGSDTQVQRWMSRDQVSNETRWFPVKLLSILQNTPD